MAATLNTFAILQWQVDPNGSVVNCEHVTQFVTYLPDGAGSTDPQIISRYILETAKDKESADRLLSLAQDGLLTVVTVQKTAVTVPSVPPHHQVNTRRTGRSTS